MPVVPSTAAGSTPPGGTRGWSFTPFGPGGRKGGWFWIATLLPMASDRLPVQPQFTGDAALTPSLFLQGSDVLDHFHFELVGHV
jgi:hypothetical protein